MSFFEDASLVLIPSAIKDQKIYSIKPTDGTGDLTFTRASNATRVASNGLIEKVRTNLILQSNTFSTTWISTNVTETSGQAGYDGTNNAWLLEGTGSSVFSYLLQNESNAVTKTRSIYAKAGTVQYLGIWGSGSNYGYFNLSDGTLDTISGAAAVSHSITAVGNGWYRCSFTTTSASSGFYIVASSIANGTSLSVGENIYIQDAQLEAGDIATDYIATTTTAVSVGPVSGLPRLDYLNSSCPRLLLEPQRTNDIINNTALNNYTATRATWGVNVATSPTGDQDAEKLIEDTTASNTHFFGIGGSYVSGTAYTWSIYIKADGRSAVRVQAGNTATFPINCDFNLSTQTTTNNGSGTAAIIDAGNGWYRCVVRNVVALATGSTNFNLFLLSGSNQTYTGNGTSGVLVWGAQREVGAYETSVIPTLSTSVTRVLDRFTKLSISSLINSQEGTLFVEMAALDSAMGTTLLSLSDGTPNNNLYIGYTATTNQISSVFATGGVAQAIFNTFAFNVTQSNKIAVSYKANDVKMYVNGTLVGSDTNATMPAAGTLNEFSSDFGQGSFPLAANISQALIFPTALTATQLAELTA